MTIRYGCKHTVKPPEYVDNTIHSNVEPELEIIWSSTIVMERMSFKELWDSVDSKKTKIKRLVLHDD